MIEIHGNVNKIMKSPVHIALQRSMCFKSMGHFCTTQHVMEPAPSANTSGIYGCFLRNELP